MLRIVITLAALFAFGIAVSGCNTIEGLGKDVESGGEALQDAAK